MERFVFVLEERWIVHVALFFSDYEYKSCLTCSTLFPVWCVRRGFSKRSTAFATRSWSTCLRVSRRRSTFVSSWSTQREATWWCTFMLMFSLSPGPCEWSQLSFFFERVKSKAHSLDCSRHLIRWLFCVLAGFMRPASYWDYSSYMTIRLCTGERFDLQFRSVLGDRSLHESFVVFVIFAGIWSWITCSSIQRATWRSLTLGFAKKVKWE